MKMGADYMVVCPEKCSLLKLVMSLVFPFVGFKSCVVDRPDHGIGSHHDGNWKMKLSLIFIKILKFVAVPLKTMGSLLEFLLNLFSYNGGLISTAFKLLNGSIRIPKRKSEAFLSFNGHLVGQSELYKSGPSKPTNPGDILFADISVMASATAYENPLLIKERINQQWKMHFVGFFKCWNDYLKKKCTKAFILCDKEEDANLIVIAFKGTSPFESDDYITDVDFSWYEYPQMGKIHFGFLEALGLKNRSNGSDDKKFPCCLKPDKEGQSVGGAYNVLHEKVKELLQVHKNAKFIVTGHSLGGALAVLFTAMLFVNEDKMLEKLLGVYTFGQPRVGDKAFADFMNSKLEVKEEASRYFRIVYSNDIVPRIPFDNILFMYKDFGACIYYNSFYSEKNLAETPNKNFSIMCFLFIKITAVGELLQSLVLHYRKGKEFKETKVSVFCRIVAVLSPGILIPGVSAHSLVNYIHAVRLGPAVLSPNLGIVRKVGDKRKS